MIMSKNRDQWAHLFRTFCGTEIESHRYCGSRTVSMADLILNRSQPLGIQTLIALRTLKYQRCEIFSLEYKMGNGLIREAVTER